MERIAKVANGITMSRAKRRSRNANREQPSAIVGADKAETATRIADCARDDCWLQSAEDEHRKWHVRVIAGSAIKNKRLSSNRRTCGRTDQGAGNFSRGDRLGERG